MFLLFRMALENLYDMIKDGLKKKNRKILLDNIKMIVYVSIAFFVVYFLFLRKGSPP